MSITEGGDNLRRDASHPPLARRAAASNDKDIHPVDKHVGGRIRKRRKALGKGQQWLADAIGLTFQQVQKYERGANRVSASKLWEIAQALQTDVGSFFEGLEGTPAADAEALAGDTTRAALESVREELLKGVKKVDAAIGLI